MPKPMRLAVHFPEFREERFLAQAQDMFDRVFVPLPTLGWQRVGTWIETWRGQHRVAFAPHRQYASLYFQEPSAVAMYRELGGICPAGQFTIRLPFRQVCDPERIRFLVSRVLWRDTATGRKR